MKCHLIIINLIIIKANKIIVFWKYCFSQACRLTRSRWGQAGFVWPSVCVWRARCSSHSRKLQCLFVVWSCLVCTHHPRLNYPLQDAFSAPLIFSAISAVISEIHRFPAKFCFLVFLINIGKYRQRKIYNSNIITWMRWGKNRSWIVKLFVCKFWNFLVTLPWQRRWDRTSRLLAPAGPLASGRTCDSHGHSRHTRAGTHHRHPYGTPDTSVDTPTSVYTKLEHNGFDNT